MEIEVKSTYTYADYSKLPEGAAYQLIEGELIHEPAPTVSHQRLVLRLARLIAAHVEEHQLGEIFISPIDVYLSDVNTFQPDVAFVDMKRLDIVKEKNIQGAPDLVIEVLSPSTAYYDLRRKKEIYALNGVREYWIVDPIKKCVEVYLLNENSLDLAITVSDSGRIESFVIKSFSVDWAELFDRGPSKSS